MFSSAFSVSSASSNRSRSRSPLPKPRVPPPRPTAPKPIPVPSVPTHMQWLPKPAGIAPVPMSYKPAYTQYGDLYTEGMSDCCCIATITPNGLRSLTHVPGSRVTKGLFDNLAWHGAIRPNTTIVIAGGGYDVERRGFLSTRGDPIVQAMQKAIPGCPGYANFKVYMPKAEHELRSGGKGLNMTGFVVMRDGKYGFLRK